MKWDNHYQNFIQRSEIMYGNKFPKHTDRLSKKLFSRIQNNKIADVQTFLFF